MTKTCPECNKDVGIFNAIAIDSDEEIVVHLTCVSSYMGTKESLRFLMNLLYGKDTEITYQIDNNTFESESDNSQVRRLVIKMQVADQENESIDQTNIIPAVYAMAAVMIGADRMLDHQEIKVAKSAGLSLLENFNPSDFARYVSNLEKIPDFFELARSLKGIDIDDKILIYNYLEIIAKGDGDFAIEEKRLLDVLKSKLYWNLNIE